MCSASVALTRHSAPSAALFNVTAPLDSSTSRNQSRNLQEEHWFARVIIASAEIVGSQNVPLPAESAESSVEPVSPSMSRYCPKHLHETKAFLSLIGPFLNLAISGA